MAVGDQRGWWAVDGAGRGTEAGDGGGGEGRQKRVSGRRMTVNNTPPWAPRCQCQLSQYANYVLSVTGRICNQQLPELKLAQICKCPCCLDCISKVDPFLPDFDLTFATGSNPIPDPRPSKDAATKFSLGERYHGHTNPPILKI